MRIAVFAEYLPPRLGSDRRIFEIMKRLSSKHEVHFVVFPSFRELRDRSVENRRKSLSHDRYSTVRFEGINGHLISVSPRVALLWQRSLLAGYCLTALFVFLKSIRTMRNVNSDIVVLNYPSPYTGLLGFLEAKLWNKPVIVDFSDLIAQYTCALLNLKKGSLAAKLLVLVQNYIVKNADWVVTPTRFIKEYAAALGIPERKISIISNGVDTNIFC
jgi:glycosyltransferase involved in cell wall biosynthesis